MNDLSMHILDILQNALTAGATRIEIQVLEDAEHNLLTITIQDNGYGMTPEQVERATDPFFTSRTTRKVGMGLPLYRQSAEQSGGTLKIESAVGEGTTVTATFLHDHLDRPPLGDLANAVVLMMSANPTHWFRFTYRYNEKSFSIDTQEINDSLEGFPINNVHVMKMIEQMIQENMAFIRH
ncbi:MAG: ATP-binding protein [Tannerella sp.]|jgi:anti-sigma regulatory factor (Ser/Thr protein kinase)|nr:ATP-binding protein [Tannerella sp.]